MAGTVYEVLVDELTLHKSVGPITDPVTGDKIGNQNGMGDTYFKGEKVAEEDITPDVLDALNDSDHPSHDAVSKRLKKSTGDAEQNTAARLGLPFDGYEDMEEDDIVNAMRVLPSAAQQRIKEFESMQDEPRDRIVNYNIGFGESNIERQEGKVSGELVEEGDDRDPEDKPTARIKMREVPEEGPVTPGEGITGTGDPELAYGTSKDEDSEPGDIKGTGNKGRQRGGRRARQPKPTGGTAKDAGGGSLASSNE
jgi:hypothetical protein